MNIYALLCLCASAICISVGLSVYVLNRKPTVNKLFTLTMLANAYWAFCLFMISQASTVEVALFWQKVLVFWPFLVALIVHFSLSFTESDLLKHKFTFVLIYVPALIFSLIDLSTNWISTTPSLTPWGYTPGIQFSIASRFDGVWAAILSLLSLIFFANYFNRIIDRTRKQQTKFVAAGFGIPILLSLLTDSLFPLMGITFPVLGSIAGTITSLLVLYAIIRYELFGFRPEIAAENIFSSMADSMALIDLKGTIFKVNHALLELLGYSEDELVGKSIGEIAQKTNIVGGEGKTPEQFVAEICAKKESRNIDITFHSKSGELRDATISCSVVTDNRGNDVGLAFVLHDVTERKEMEQRLLNAERLASIGDLAGILGHDLRNPLHAIRIGAYYLKTKYADTLDDKDLLIFKSIDQSIDYSNKIVTDLIEYASEIKLRPDEATAKSLVLEALDSAVPPENVQVIDETQETPQLQVDADRIRRAFMNIMINAYDSMPKGGVLTLKTHDTVDMMIFSFIDTGLGMTQETLSRIWTPLFTTKAKGMGFGLAIAKRIIEAHDGKISAESQVNKGTTITVELPLRLNA